MCVIMYTAFISPGAKSELCVFLSVTRAPDEDTQEEVSARTENSRNSFKHVSFSRTRALLEREREREPRFVSAKHYLFFYFSLFVFTLLCSRISPVPRVFPTTLRSLRTFIAVEIKRRRRYVLYILS